MLDNKDKKLVLYMGIMVGFIQGFAVSFLSNLANSDYGVAVPVAGILVLSALSIKFI